MTAMGSKPLTADDDTKEFMRELEMSARKVLLIELCGHTWYLADMLVSCTKPLRDNCARFS